MLKLMNIHNDMILVNPDHIIKVRPYNNGIVIRFTNGESEELIPGMTVEEFLVKSRETSSDLGKMTDALCSRIQHLEDVIASGLQYVGKSCH
jgi:hypothetical protein